MSSGGDQGEEDHEQACGGQNVFREVFDERSEPSETGETLRRHTYKLCALRERSLNHQLHTITHIDLISMQNKMIQKFEPRFLSLSELFEYAKKIGIALPEERHLLPIAR